jgi:hypothetical protein
MARHRGTSNRGGKSIFRSLALAPSLASPWEVPQSDFNFHVHVRKEGREELPFLLLLESRWMWVLCRAVRELKCSRLAWEDGRGIVGGIASC